MTSSARDEAQRQAICSHNNKKVALLIKAGVAADGECDGTPFLEYAAMVANEEAFNLLVAHGANCDSDELLHTAVSGDSSGGPVSLGIVQAILSRKEFDAEALNAALRYACVSGSLPVVDALLSRGADVNARDEKFLDFPLANAVREQNLELVARLLKAGANPTMHDVVEEMDDQVSTLKMSLVEFSALKSTREITKMLMDNVTS